LRTLRSFPTRRSSDLARWLEHVGGVIFVHESAGVVDDRFQRLIGPKTAMIPSRCGKGGDRKTIGKRVISFRGDIVQLKSASIEKDRKSTRLNSSHVKI